MKSMLTLNVFLSTLRCAVTRGPSDRDPGLTFSFREELDELVSGGLLDVLAVLLQGRAHHGGGLIVTGHLMGRGEEGDHSLNTHDAFLMMLYWQPGSIKGSCF